MALPGGFLAVPDPLGVTLYNVPVRVMMRRVTDSKKFEGWLSGQTFDLRGEIGFGSCLLALAAGGDKLGKLPPSLLRARAGTHTHAPPLHAISISFSAKHEIKAIYNLADNYIILIPSRLAFWFLRYNVTVLIKPSLAACLASRTVYSLLACFRSNSGLR